MDARSVQGHTLRAVSADLTRIDVGFQGGPVLAVRATAMRLFAWSITYITLLFGAMALDQLLRSGW